MIPFIGDVCTYPKALKNRKNISVIIKPPHSISPAPATGGAPRRKEQMNKLSLSSRMYWHCFPAHLKLQVCSFSSVKPVPSQNLFASAKVTSVSQLPTLKTHCHLQILLFLLSFTKLCQGISLPLNISPMPFYCYHNPSRFLFLTPATTIKLIFPIPGYFRSNSCYSPILDSLT